MYANTITDLWVITIRAHKGAYVLSSNSNIYPPITEPVHSSMHPGVKATSEQLKRAILDFVNNVSWQDDSIQVGHVSGASVGEPEDGIQTDSFDGNFVNAVGKGTQFYHRARAWARVGTTKARAAGSSGAIRMDKAGKSKGKGPIGGCWSCGGAHYQSGCPRGTGKGKGKVGLRPFTGVGEYSGWSEEDWGSEVRVIVLSLDAGPAGPELPGGQLSEARAAEHPEDGKPP